jgi:hypothetical protein
LPGLEKVKKLDFCQEL